MRTSAFFAAGVLLLWIQSNTFRVASAALELASWAFRSEHVWTLPGFVPSLVLPLLLFMGVHEYSLVRGAWVSCLLGYLTDLAGIAPVGLYTFAHVAIYVLARAVGVRFAAQTMWVRVVLVLGFTLVHSLMVLVLLAIFGGSAWVARTLYPMVLPHLLATALTAPLIFRLALRLHQATVASPARDLRSGA